jgi:chorismate dehydratase
MSYPIAMIPYANMAPFQEMGPPDGGAFVHCLPRESIQALKLARVWAAAVPVGGLAALGDAVAPLGRFGIAVREQSMSVLFFSDRPFDDFSGPLTLALTGESASSVRLLYLLLGYRHGFDAMPGLVPWGSISNGCLVIGDKALRWARAFEEKGTTQHGYGHVADLSALWHGRFQLPFVFARWVVRNDAPDAIKAALTRWLNRFAAQEPDLIVQATPRVSRELGLPMEVVARYLNVIRRCLTKEDETAQQLFCTELAKHTAEPLFAPAGERSLPQERF